MNERPQRDEASEYYFTYIDQVGDGDIVDTLRAQGDDVVVLLRTISDAHSLHRYAPDKWSIREVIGHLNDTERLFVARAFWFARGFTTPLPSFDQHVAVRSARSDDRPWPDHIAEFDAVRRATIAFLTNLPVEGWQRRGIASDNPFSVRALAYLAAGHVTHHLSILRSRYL